MALGGNASAVAIGNIIRDTSSHGSYTRQVCELSELKYLYPLLYPDWSPQPFETLLPHFPKFTKKKSIAFPKKLFTIRCDWPNFINDAFKAYGD